MGERKGKRAGGRRDMGRRMGLRGGTANVQALLPENVSLCFGDAFESAVFFFLDRRARERDGV